jgi:prepilin-type N-terminal cleavage/methylation domain-containing protein
MKTRRRSNGFTLIEVLVALAIAGGTLVLVLSAVNGSMKRSVQAQEELEVVRAAESQFDQCLLGIEGAMSGDLRGRPGWTWEVLRLPTRMAGLKKLRRFTFVVRRSDGSKASEWSAIREEAP